MAAVAPATTARRTSPRRADPRDHSRFHPDDADPATTALDVDRTPPGTGDSTQDSAEDGSGGLGDGLALSISSLLGSVAGLVSWLIAARIMPTAQVGDAQLVVTAFILIGGMAQLNVGVGLMRWLPAAGRSTARLVGVGFAVIMPLSALIGVIYALAVPRIATITAGEGPWVVGLALFVLACAGWVAFVVHDFVLVTLGKPWWAVWRNGLFAVVRIVLLVVLGGLAGLGAYGVVLSWIGPIVVWIAAGTVVVLLLARRISRDAGRRGTLPATREAAAFLGPTAIAQMGVALLYNQVPLLVNLRFGGEVGAVFFIAWQAVTVLELAGSFFMNSLAVSVAREPHRTAELAAAARKRLLLVFLPLLAVGAAVAHPALLVFGPDYAAADNVLRLLLLGLAFRLVVVHELGVRQAVGAALSYARLQLLSSVLVLVVAAFTPVTGGGIDSLLPVTIGYIVVQVVCALGVLFSPARRRADAEVVA